MDTYDFESKHLYRKRRELCIDRFAVGSFRDRKVAYLDTREALDTISYLKRGYRPKNLWAINRDPVEVALLTQKLDKLGLPRINTCGLEFEEALEKRVPEVNIIDFDGMSCIHQKLLDMLHRIVNKRPNVLYGLTLLGGREQSKNDTRFAFSEKAQYNKVRNYFPEELFVGTDTEGVIVVQKNLLDEFAHLVTHAQTRETSFGTIVNASHHDRLSVVFEAFNDPSKAGTKYVDASKCKIHVIEVRWDVYVSISNQPMIWAIFRTEPHRSLQLSDIPNYIKRTDCLATPECRVEDYVKSVNVETKKNKFLENALHSHFLSWTRI